MPQRARFGADTYAACRRLELIAGAKDCFFRLIAAGASSDNRFGGPARDARTRRQGARSRNVELVFSPTKASVGAISFGRAGGVSERRNQRAQFDR
jgi:hypothetical protein